MTRLPKGSKYQCDKTSLCIYIYICMYGQIIMDLAKCFWFEALDPPVQKSVALREFQYPQPNDVES